MSLTERLHWIHAQIMDDRYPNARTVSEHFEISRRSAYQDRVYMVNRLHAPIKTDRKRDGWYYTDKTYILPFLALTEKEATGLRRTLLAAQEYMGAQEVHSIQVLYNRLSPYLSQTDRDMTGESVGGMIHFVPEAQVDPALLEASRLALRNRCRLWIRYHGAHKDEISERVIRPYHLHFHLGEPHLICWCEWKSAMRQFHLSRVLNWTLLEGEHAFVRDPDFDIDRYLQNGMGVQHGTAVETVRVLFTAYQARWIRERRYHRSQQNESLPDGRLLVTLHVSGMPEVARWVLSYGAEAEVLEPPSLRLLVSEHIKKLSNIYASDPE